MKEFIGTGKTIEEAINSAKVGLNAPMTADVKTEIVAMPKKKVLGLFGGSDAKVRAYYEEKPAKNQKRSSDKKKSKKQEQKKSAPAKELAPKQKAKPEPKKEVNKAKSDEARADEVQSDTISAKEIDLDYACSYIKKMIDSFNVDDAKLSASFNDGVVEVDIECENYGIIIGRRGETLDAIQYLTSLAIKNQTGKYVRVTVNVGDYRAKREETLKALATKQANYVVRTGRRYGFEPMNPYERRIIHTAVSEIDGVESRSTGVGTDRRVIIEPTGGVKYSSNKRGGGRGRSSAPRQAAKPDASREKRVDRADIPKFGKIEINK